MAIQRTQEQERAAQAWQDPETKVEVYQAEVFGEKELQ